MRSTRVWRILKRTKKTAKEVLQVGFGGISKPGIKMKCALSEKGGQIVGAARFTMHRTQKMKGLSLVLYPFHI